MAATRRDASWYFALTLAASCCAASAVLLSATLWPQASWVRGLPIATGHEDLARRSLNAADQDPALLILARQETEAGLRVSPMNAWAWLRLSLIEKRSAGDFGEASAQALRQSYAVSPFGPQVTSWRLRYAFDNWNALPADLKEAAKLEMKTSWLERQDMITQTIVGIPDERGRLTARLYERRLRIDYSTEHERQRPKVTK